MRFQSTLFAAVAVLTAVQPSAHAFQLTTIPRSSHRRINHDEYQTTTSLYAEQSRKKGVYARPSAAIERGSGFFIPGLEGPRVRLLFGLIVLALTVVNHGMIDTALTSSEATTSMALPETLAVAYSILLLLQAAIEFSKDETMSTSLPSFTGGTETATARSSLSQDLLQQWSSSSTDISDEYRDKVQWAAATYISLTPATQMLLLDRKDLILYRLGGGDTTASSASLSQTQGEGVATALETLAKTSSGRVSLPVTHPVVQALVPLEYEDQESNRCIVLQRINEHQCWLMASNQLLAAFTKADLKWLGQLAKYVAERT